MLNNDGNRPYIPHAFILINKTVNTYSGYSKGPVILKFNRNDIFLLQITLR